MFGVIVDVHILSQTFVPTQYRASAIRKPKGVVMNTRAFLGWLTILVWLASSPSAWADEPCVGSKPADSSGNTSTSTQGQTQANPTVPGIVVDTAGLPGVSWVDTIGWDPISWGDEFGGDFDTFDSEPGGAGDDTPEVSPTEAERKALEAQIKRLEDEAKVHEANAKRFCELSDKKFKESEEELQRDPDSLVGLILLDSSLSYGLLDLQSRTAAAKARNEANDLKQKLGGPSK